MKDNTISTFEVTDHTLSISNVMKNGMFLQHYSKDSVFPEIKVRVTGVAKSKGLAYTYCLPDGTFNLYYMETDGEHILPASTHTENQNYTGFRCNFLGECNIYLELI